jgi:hypothetical protein
MRGNSVVFDDAIVTKINYWLAIPLAVVGLAAFIGFKWMPEGRFSALLRQRKIKKQLKKSF